MRQLIILLSLISCTILFSCTNSSNGGSAEQNPLLVEANTYHLEAMETEKQFKTFLLELQSMRTSIQVQGRELNEEEMGFIDMMNRIEETYKNWTKNRIEVPGFEHAHDHSDGHHHHHHGSDVKLTPQQMLDVQKESLRDMNNILSKTKYTYEKSLAK